jgi:hypothetical protein
MAKKNVRGICRLCKKHAQLCKSHYIARAFHSLNRQFGEDPVVMTPRRVMLTPRQVWAHLLCGPCESRMNKFGEAPVLKLVDNGHRFPLLDKMNRHEPIKVEEKSTTYSAINLGIDTNALAHFALGFLWKAAVHKWRTLEGQEISIILGEFEEPIRRYVLGETGLPPSIFVLASVCEDVGSRGMVWAPAQLSGLPIMFWILARGLWFHIAFDDKPPKGIEQLCCVQSLHKVIIEKIAASDLWTSVAICIEPRASMIGCAAAIKASDSLPCTFRVHPRRCGNHTRKLARNKCGTAIRI